MECTSPCYKCDIPGHHSARCPYSVNRAPDLGASSSSHSSAQSTPERPMRPTSVAQIIHQQWRSHPRGVCYLPPLLHPVHPWGEVYSPWVPFCPCHQWEEGLSCWVPWTGIVARLRPGLGSPRHPSYPASRAPGLQQQLGLPLFPLPHLRHSRDLVRPRLGSSSSAPPVPPLSPPQCPQLFWVQVRRRRENSLSHPPAPRPWSSLTKRLSKVIRWEGWPEDRVRPHPVAPRERVQSLPRAEWPQPQIRSLSLPGSSLQRPGAVRSPKGVSLAGSPFPVKECWIPCIGKKNSCKKRYPSLKMILP